MVQSAAFWKKNTCDSNFQMSAKTKKGQVTQQENSREETETQLGAYWDRDNEREFLEIKWCWFPAQKRETGGKWRCLQMDQGVTNPTWSWAAFCFAGFPPPHPTFSYGKFQTCGTVERMIQWTSISHHVDSAGVQFATFALSNIHSFVYPSIPPPIHLIFWYISKKLQSSPLNNAYH